MKRYRFWFNDTNYGISKGYTIQEAFKFFLDFGFDYLDVIKIDIEEII